MEDPRAKRGAMEEEEEIVEEAVAGGRTSATDDASTSGLVKQLFDASIRCRVSSSLLSECRSREKDLSIGVDLLAKENGEKQKQYLPGNLVESVIEVYFRHERLTFNKLRSL